MKYHDHQHDHDREHERHHEHHRARARREERIAELLRARHPGFPGGFGPGFGPGMHGFGPRAAHFAAEMGAMGGLHGFGPRGRRPKGDVRFAILSLLAEDGTASLNGYGIMKAIQERTDGAWNPSPGSVYPTLQQLVDEGLVAASGDGRKTEYTLTDDGRAYAAEHAEQLGAWANVQQPSDASRELMEAIGKVMPVIGQFRFAATDAQRSAAAAKVEELRKALYLILAE